MSDGAIDALQEQLSHHITVITKQFDAKNLQVKDQMQKTQNDLTSDLEHLKQQLEAKVQDNA